MNILYIGNRRFVYMKVTICQLAQNLIQLVIDMFCAAFLGKGVVDEVMVDDDLMDELFA